MKKVKDYFVPFLAHKKREGIGEHTLGEYKRFVKETLSCIAEKKVKDLKIADNSYVMELGRLHGYWGQQRAISVLRQFYKYLNDNGENLTFRWYEVKLPKVRDHEQDFLTPEEFESLVLKLPQTFYGLRDRTLYELLWSTGLRINEALQIDIKDIDWQNKEIKVHTAKGGEGDKVYISERLEEWLHKYLARRGDECPALFIVYFLEVHRLNKVMARKNLAKYRKEMGIEKKITHHAFRRGFCTYLLNSGANIKEVQILARHRSERTTLRFYTKVRKEQVKDVHQNIFNKIFSKVNTLIATAK